jgi:hypothetical protein
MSHIVKQTISVRSGNGVEDSFIFMIQRYVRLSQRCYFAFARFSRISYEVVRNPSFGIRSERHLRRVGRPPHATIAD